VIHRLFVVDGAVQQVCHRRLDATAAHVLVLRHADAGVLIDQGQILVSSVIIGGTASGVPLVSPD
jgi:hypothetical protein